MTDPAPTSPPIAPPRRRRWLRRALLFVALLVAALAVALVVVVRGLDQPWLKRRLQAVARSSANLDLDYRATHIGLSGLRIEDVVVLTPEGLRPLAPELARVGELEVRWKASWLWNRAGPPLTSVSLRQVAVTIVSDKQRGTSLDAFSSPEPSPKPPAQPLSHQMTGLLGMDLPVARVDLEDVRATLISAADGRELERVALRGLAVHLVAEHAPSGSRLRAELGTPALPLDLALERAGHGSARLRLALGAQASASQVRATLDLQVAEQTLVPHLAVEKLLDLEASVRFDTAAGLTHLTVARLDAADGSVSAQANLDLPDGNGAPLLREAKGELDLAQALRHVPPDLVPIELDAGRLSFRVGQLLLSATPSLAQTGSVGLDTSVQGLRVTLADGSLLAATAQLSLEGKPKPGAQLGAHVSASFDGLKLALGKRRIDASGVATTIDATLASDGSYDGDIELRLGHLDAAVGTVISALEARLGVHVQGLKVDTAAPLASRGLVALKLQAGTLAVDRAPWRVQASGLGLDVRSQLHGGAPYAVDVDLPIGQLDVWGAGGRAMLHSGLHLNLGIKEAYPELDRLLRSRAVAKLGLELGAVHVTLDLAKQVDAADFTLGVQASSLAAAAPFAPANATWKLPWEQMALTLHSTGRVEQLSSKAPLLTEKSELQIDRPGAVASGRTASADRLELTLRSDGTPSRQNADLELKLRKLILDATPRGDSRLALSLAVDAAAPSLRLQLDGGGEAGPDASVGIKASFDRPGRALTYDVTAHLGRLEPLTPLLQGRGSLTGLELAQLDAALSAHGVLIGVVEEIGFDGSVKIAAKPLASLGGEDHVELKVKGVQWASGDLEVEVPAATWQGDLKSEGGKQILHSDLSLDSAHVALGDHQVDLGGMSDSLDATSSDPAAGEVELRQHLSLRTIRQDWLPGYPLGELDLSLQAHRDAEGTVKASAVRLDNRAAGTSLTLEGSAELGGFRRTLSLRGELQQDLARAWAVRETFEGSGKLTMQLHVDSADLRIFHALAEAQLVGAQLNLPGAGVKIENLNAEIPVQADVSTGPKGISLLAQSGGSAFSQLRFADQHPFQSRRSYISIAKLTTPVVSISPLAGNLEISRGVIQLSQLELGVRHGLVTGQCALHYQGKDPTLVARVRASGVESSHGEPFDGNLAVSISTRERSVEGRAEILRIGSRHLLDLLDFQDPHRADGSLNTIRTALALGYPDHVRLSFNHGFASLKVTFGGVAQVLKLDEVRGIPVGPLLDKVLARVLAKEEP